MATIEDAYEEGAQAYFAGEEIQDCPYVMGSVGAKAWLDGYEDASITWRTSISFGEDVELPQAEK